MIASSSFQACRRIDHIVNEIDQFYYINVGTITNDGYNEILAKIALAPKLLTGEPQNAGDLAFLFNDDKIMARSFMNLCLCLRDASQNRIFSIIKRSDSKVSDTHIALTGKIADATFANTVANLIAVSSTTGYYGGALGVKNLEW